jgi:RING finger protein 113A
VCISQGNKVVSRVAVEASEAPKKIEASATEEARTADGQLLYKGMSGYKRLLKVAPKPKALRTGPVKASSNVRISVRFDYQPDICKDW